MKRTVSAHLEFNIDSRANLVFSIAAALPDEGVALDERISFVKDGEPIEPIEIADLHRTRLHQLISEPGVLVVDYWAEVTGQSGPPAVAPLDLITYLRPSRYAESDALLPTAQAEFSGLTGRDLLTGVSSWVGSHLRYVPGSSQPTDGARETLLDRRGVCRDYAHLCVALLRALDVPARLVSVYAPGLSPMDFHAVCEAYVDDAWHVVDATALAPRQTLLRIATGRDAADTAFLTSHWGNVTVRSMEVTATVDELPYDDVRDFVSLG
ncbi:transglutaminase family protein [Amnibacterium flavum]|uniref:Transglutaminase n=1 Tax=Amnibacterium flavum TaxID=2173173 RepID=A0A2V1HY93_9MICO|nr:transglutaminase family protein [Amnibacterium flavum]PVZ96429.1 transglutaminase [Amnibacterium flavum]